MGGPSLLLALLLGCGVPVPPTADAGPDVTLELGEDWSLAGDGWSEATITEWRWSVIRAPSGSTVAPSPPDAQTTRITPDEPGYYTFGLMVADAWGNTSTLDAVNVVVTTDDLPPVAELETIESLDPPALYLDGRASYDPEGVNLGYTWRLLVTPDGAAPSITPASLTGTAILEPDVSGIYVVGLSVDDGWQDSELVSASWQIELD